MFGDKGYVETLGQTWEMIHDPRFAKIEGTFIVNRKATFGGDARQGKQYQSSDGMFVSTISDLEEYSEVLGEGRYFWIMLTHPEERCPVRLWLERIYPDMVSKKAQEIPKAGEDLKSICGVAVKAGQVKVSDPHDLKDAPDDFLWALVKQECPNYFDKADKPNKEAKRLFNLFRADLVGLVADYTPTPLVDAFVELDTGDIIHGSATGSEQPAKVFLEVDILEKALTYRATMRATAAKVLRQIGIEAQLRALPDPRLTDEERDHLLRMVYQSDWPEGKVELVTKLISYISWRTREPYEERLQNQLKVASLLALEDCRDLQTGKLEPINSYTEPSVEVKLDQHAAVMEALLRNPLKQELFLIYVGAEERCDYENNDCDDEDRLNMRKLFSILTPVFTDPDFVVDEDKYWDYLEEAKKLGYYEKVNLLKPYNSDFVPSEEDFARNRKLREARGEKRMPLPPDEEKEKAVTMNTTLSPLGAHEVPMRTIEGELVSNIPPAQVNAFLNRQADNPLVPSKEPPKEKTDGINSDV